MGDGGVGERRSMLRVVPGTLRRNEKSVRSGQHRREAARVLAELKQGERSVSEYSIEFRTLAVECRWNDEAQWDMFLHGLADRIHVRSTSWTYQRISTDSWSWLLEWMHVSSRMERRIPPSRHPGLTESQRSSGGDAVGHIHDPEPMQVGRARLSREEKERRRSQGLCMYCGAAGHFASHCPVKEQARR